MAITRLANNDLLTPSKGQSVRSGNVVGQFYNAASGGNTTTDVSNYNGTGQTWRVHTFTANGTLTVTGSNTNFSVFIVGGGKGGNNSLNQDGTAASGYGGGVLSNASATIPNGSYTVTIGSGGAGGSGSYNAAGAVGGATTIGSLFASGTQSPSSTGVATTISGSSATYGKTGPTAPSGYANGSSGAANTGDGGQGAGRGTPSELRGGNGGSGIAIIAYRIA